MADARPMRYYTLPLTLDTRVDISGPFPLTAEEWARLSHLMAAMSPGLAETPVPVERPDFGEADDADMPA